MCGRFVQYSDPEIYASHFDLDDICRGDAPLQRRADAAGARHPRDR